MSAAHRGSDAEGVLDGPARTGHFTAGRPDSHHSPDPHERAGTHARTVNNSARTVNGSAWMVNDLLRLDRQARIRAHPGSGSAQRGLCQRKVDLAQQLRR